MSHPEQRRLAEIIVTRDEVKSRGSGYAVAPGWVLTADHVIRDADDVTVWLGAPTRLKPGDGESIARDCILRAPTADMALIPVTLATYDNVLFGRPDPNAVEPMPYVAAGFPRFKLRPAPDNPRVFLREVHYASGCTSAGSNAKTGTLEFVSSLEPAADDDPDRSPWEGMSGAAIFASGTGRIVGVVGQHHRAESRRVLTGRSMTSLFDADPTLWRHALPQLEPSADELTVTSRPTERALVDERAQVTAAQLSPPVLVAREDQIGRLNSFVHGPERWLWLQGDAFAGKTALLAWFVLHQPADVDIAACFLRRTTDSANARYALDVLCRQLAVHADRGPYQRPEHLSQQREEFDSLLVQAAGASRGRGRRLLVLVDGLDEDETAEPGLVVTKWIPDADTLPENVGIIVTSRSGVAIDLPTEHPLRQHVDHIGASPAASEIERMAREELDQALQAGGLVYDLLGLLTVAHEGLTLAGLTELVSQHTPVLTLRVTRTLRDDLSRTILHLPHPAAPDEQVLIFAHAVLLDQARADYAADLPALRRQLVDWCHERVSRASVANPVPSYVTRHYADQLAAQPDWSDCWNDLLTPSWAALRERDPATYLPYRSDLDQLLLKSASVNDAAISTGSEAPAIAGAVTAVAATAALESQFQATTPELVAVMVEQGLWTSRRALQYTGGIPNADARARAVGSIAPVLDPGSCEDLFAIYQRLDGEDDERGIAALGISRFLVAAARSAEATDFAESEAEAGRPGAACHAAAGALRGLPPNDAARMLSLVAQWTTELHEYDLWRFVERLGQCLSRAEATRLSIGRDPGLYLLELLSVPDDDVQNSAEALKTAASWMNEGILEQRCRVLLDRAHDEQAERPDSDFLKYAESDVLAVLAGIAPPGARSRILERSGQLGHRHKLQTMAGLLLVDDGNLTPTLLRALSPQHTPLRSVGGTDEKAGALTQLAKSRHGRLAVDYIETDVAASCAGWELDQYVEAVVPHLELDELRRLNGIVAQFGTPTQARMLGDVSAWTIRRAGAPSVSSTPAGSMSADAGRLARLSMTGHLPSSGALPVHRSLRFAAALVAAQDGKLGLRDVLRELADPPPGLAAALLPDAVGLLPIDEAGIDELVDFCIPRGLRIVDATLRALAAKAPDSIDRVAAELFSSDDPMLQAHILSIYGPQLIRTGIDVSEFSSGRSSDFETFMYRAALADEADLSALEAEFHTLSRSRQLRVFEVLALPLRPALLKRLGDAYITGGDREVTELWASKGLPVLIRFMDPRQLEVLESAIDAPQQRDLSGTTLSMLHAEVAIRWARSGNFDAFRRTVSLVSRTNEIARTLAVVALDLPADQLTDWFDLLNERVQPAYWPWERVIALAFVHGRWPSTNVETAWEIVQQWISRSATTVDPIFDQPWQVLADLAGYGKALTKVGGRATGQQLCQLLVTAGFLATEA
jgi:hypothetical protein